MAHCGVADDSDRTVACEDAVHAGCNGPADAPASRITRFWAAPQLHR